MNLIFFTGITLPANAEARSFAAAFYKYIGQESTSELNILQPSPVRLMPGGLEEIVSDGFAVLRNSSLASGAGSDLEGKTHLRPISMEKLVYRI
jgi:hypothetical protein